MYRWTICASLCHLWCKAPRQVVQLSLSYLFDLKFFCFSLIHFFDWWYTHRHLRNFPYVMLYFGFFLISYMVHHYYQQDIYCASHEKKQRQCHSCTRMERLVPSMKLVTSQKQSCNCCCCLTWQSYQTQLLASYPVDSNALCQQIRKLEYFMHTCSFYRCNSLWNLFKTYKLSQLRLNIHKPIWLKTMWMGGLSRSCALCISFIRLQYKSNTYFIAERTFRRSSWWPRFLLWVYIHCRFSLAHF